MTTLREEIRQTKPFETIGDEAMLSIFRTASVLEHGAAEVLRPHGITHTQYNVLRILKGAGARGLCGREIGERLISRVPDVSRLLDRMEEMALVSKARDAGDKRHVTARLTAKGRRVLAQATPDLAAFGRGRAARVPNRTLEALVRALEAVRAEP